MSLLACGRLCHKSSLNFIERVGVRYKKGMKGKPPELAKNLQQVLAEQNYEDPELHYRVNIGLPMPKLVRKDVMMERYKQRLEIKRNHELELAARHRTLHMDLAKIYKDWTTTSAIHHIYEIAKYYNVFEDLFEESYFYPVVPLEIQFEYPKDTSLVTPVYRGNLIKPSESIREPDVLFDAKADELYTLMLTTPDCHMTQDNGEYLHWLIGNIKGNDVRNGELLCDYMRPFPLRGIGYCRYIFILYKQHKKIDFSTYKRQIPTTNLTERTFSTYDFYKDFQDDMTPAGLAFFLSTWDHSLTKFFQDTLDMAEPIVEFDFPPIEMDEQEWFPHGRPFNIYLDRYKDPKELNKELLIEKFKERHPFKPAPVPPKYPLAYHIERQLPTWLKTEIKRKRMKEGKWKFM